MMRIPSRARTAGLAALAAMLAAAGVAPAAVYYVDRASRGGQSAGTADVTYSTISAAIRDHHGPGVTIVVRPGVYCEVVRISASGAPGNPFVLQADGPGVVIEGADDYASAALWSQVAGDVWLAAGVSWTPKQVFADGGRLQASTVAPVALPAGTFCQVPGTGLYVNAGPGGPPAHGVLVGRRAYGFDIDGSTDVRIDGFTVFHTEDRGIRLQAGSDRDTIANNVVGYAGSYGIWLTSCTGVRIASNVVAYSLNSGIGFVYGITGSTVEDNDSFGHAYPAWRQANGIYVRGSSGNRFLRNRLHDNQDSGLDLGAGSNNNLCIENLSWRNGDHGFDHTRSTGNRHIGEVAWGNHMDGFSFEGYSSGGSLRNCIAAENGLATNEYDLWVDPASWVGFQSDYNLFWNTTSQTPVRVGLARFSSVAAFSAWGSTDAHSLQAEPRFKSPTGGCFELLPGSPAIDAGDSSVPDWPALDATLDSRTDDPASPNRGTGSVSYADIGALEYNGGRVVPLSASLGADPPRGTPPIIVVADASASSCSKDRVVSYEFSFGDGTSSGPVLDPRVRHVYESRGMWTVAVTVRDAWGHAARAESQVDLTTPPPPRTVHRFGAGTAAGNDAGGVTASAVGTATEPAPGTTAEAFPGRGPLQVRLAPNPMHDEGVLSFTTSRSGPLRVALFDLNGRRVRALLDEADAPAGPRLIRIPRGQQGLASGIYFYRIEAAEAAATGRIVVTP